MNNEELKDAIRELLGVIDGLHDQDNFDRSVVDRIRREVFGEENPIIPTAVVSIESVCGLDTADLGVMYAEARSVFDNSRYGCYYDILMPLDKTSSEEDILQYLFDNCSSLAESFYDDYVEFDDVCESGDQLKDVHFDIMRQSVRIVSVDA